MYKSRMTLWGINTNISREEWMKIAVLLRDREAAGKTEPALIQVGNRKLAREDYCKFLEYYGASNAEFLKTAMDFCDSAAGKVVYSMAHVHVTDAPMTDRQGAEDPGRKTTCRNFPERSLYCTTMPHF